TFSLVDSDIFDRAAASASTPPCNCWAAAASAAARRARGSDRGATPTPCIFFPDSVLNAPVPCVTQAGVSPPPPALTFLPPPHASARERAATESTPKFLIACLRPAPERPDRFPDRGSPRPRSSRPAC